MPLCKNMLLFFNQKFLSEVERHAKKIKNGVSNIYTIDTLFMQSTPIGEVVFFFGLLSDQNLGTPNVLGPIFTLFLYTLQHIFSCIMIDLFTLWDSCSLSS